MATYEPVPGNYHFYPYNNSIPLPVTYTVSPASKRHPITSEEYDRLVVLMNALAEKIDALAAQIQEIGT